MRQGIYGSARLRRSRAVGDCASIKDKDGKPFPPTAQHAIRQGKVLAHNIEATVRGGKKKPFVFETIGQLAALGRRTGVAQILGYNFSGFIAWWLWRTIYLMKLPRFEKTSRCSRLDARSAIYKRSGAISDFAGSDRIRKRVSENNAAEM